MGLIIRVAVYAASLWLAVFLIDGLQFEGTWISLVVIALILAAVNAVVRPILKFLSFPLVLLSLGLFLLVINALMLALTIWIAAALEIQFTSDGFVSTFLGALVISVVAWIGEAVFDRS